MVANVIHKVFYYETILQCNVRIFFFFFFFYKISISALRQKVLTQYAKYVSAADNLSLDYKFQLLYVKHLLIPGRKWLEVSEARNANTYSPCN